MLYSKTVTEYFTNPRNVGDIADASGRGETASGDCGDRMRVTVRVEEGKIADAKFMSYGCGASIAAASAATEWIKGKTLGEAMALDNRTILDLLGGLPPEKLHCSMLAEETVRAALLDALNKSDPAGGSASDADESDPAGNGGENADRRASDPGQGGAGHESA